MDSACREEPCMDANAVSPPRRRDSSEYASVGPAEEADIDTHIPRLF